MENIFIITKSLKSSHSEALFNCSNVHKYTSMVDAINAIDLRTKSSIMCFTPEGKLVDWLSMDDTFDEGWNTFNRIVEYLHMEECDLLDGMLRRMKFEASLCGGALNVDEVDFENDCSLDDYFIFSMKPTMIEAKKLLRSSK